MFLCSDLCAYFSIRLILTKNDFCRGSLDAIFLKVITKKNSNIFIFFRQRDFRRTKLWLSRLWVVNTCHVVMFDLQRPGGVCAHSNVNELASGRMS